MSGSQDMYSNQNSVLVLLLRRDAKELSQDELRSIELKFPDCNIVYRRIDPSDYKGHAEICEELKPDAVILPLERPIPSLAMEQGVPHLAYVQDGYKKLLPLVPQFEEFTPEA